MCGIAGFLFDHPHDDHALLRLRLANMAERIRHRGPDALGTWTDGQAGLSHTRLAVIDLSDAGKQPMSNEDNTIVLSFNGEIYNFMELRGILEKAGHRFRGHSDTEVLLRGYEQWGEDVVHHLRGMFAFAIWDSLKKHLFLARDRLGKKPLYYWHDNKGLFLFGSEIKSLLAWPEVPRNPNLLAIHHYLTFQYTPSPLTAFEGIARLPPASRMWVRPGKSHRIERYWQLPVPSDANPRPFNELKEELVSILTEAVKLRMQADVPLGAFLSGGVDSSAVVAIMAQVSGTPVKTFTIGFDEKDYDETRYARMVADRYATDHHELIIHPDSMAVLPKIAWHYNEPYADPSAIPTYYVSELARQHVTVTLNGDGGDEALLGYGRYERALQFPPYISPLSKHIFQGAAHVLRRLPRRIRNSRLIRSLDFRISRADTPYHILYSPSIAYFQDADKENGYGDALRPFLSTSSLELLYPYFEQSPDPVTGAAWADIHTYLPDDLLVKVDIASMAHALETRSPLLDHIFYEWAARIPSSVKMKNNITKALLKSAMEPHLPKQVLYRRKMGFGVPVEHWLKNELRGLTDELLLSSRFFDRGLFDPKFVKKLIGDHRSGASNNQNNIWAMIMLELWYRTWIDKNLDSPLTF